MKPASLLLASLLAGAAPTASSGADLTGLVDLAGAFETHFEQRALDSYLLPVGRFTETVQPARKLEGRVTERVLRLDDAEISSLEALRDVEAQLSASGYVRLYDCATDTCGGFDFRFNIQVIDAPAMEFDLNDFRFLSAEHVGLELVDNIGVLVSLAGGRIYLQMISVETPIDPTQAIAPISPPDDLAAALRQRFEQSGQSVLDDVNFVSGKSELSEGSDPMLAALATVMREAPDLSVAIVGHTDSEGDAAANQKLSEARAATVVKQLVEQFEADPKRLSAHGVGFLAPAASNATEEGRKANRRVVAVVK